LLAQWFTFNVVMRRAEPKNVKVADVFHRYYYEHGINKASAGGIRRHLQRALECTDGNPVVSDFGLQHQELVVRRLQDRRYAPGAVKRIMTSVKASLMWAFNREIILSHPAFVRLSEGDPPERVASISDIARFWDAAEQHHLQAFTMGLLCTLSRPTAVLELTRFQCDLARGVVDLNPAGRRRTKKRRPVVPLAAAFRPWVEATAGHLVTYRDKPVRKINACGVSPGARLAWMKILYRTPSDTRWRRSCVRVAFRCWRSLVSSDITCRISGAQSATPNTPRITCRRHVVRSMML
jgi:hypothetical protein